LAARVNPGKVRSRKLFEESFQCSFLVVNKSHEERIKSQETKPGEAISASKMPLNGNFTAFSSNIRLSLKEVGSGVDIFTKNFPFKNVGLKRLKRYFMSLLVDQVIDGGYVIKLFALSNGAVPLSIGTTPFKMISSDLMSLDTYISALVFCIECDGPALDLIWVRASSLGAVDFKNELIRLGLAKSIMKIFGILRLKDSQMSTADRIEYLKKLYNALCAIRPLLAKTANERVLPNNLKLESDAK
jgi:hypothetical protein